MRLFIASVLLLLAVQNVRDVRGVSEVSESDTAQTMTDLWDEWDLWGSQSGDEFDFEKYLNGSIEIDLGFMTLFPEPGVVTNVGDGLNVEDIVDLIGKGEFSL